MAIKKKTTKERPRKRANIARSEHPLALAIRKAGTSQKWLSDESGVQLPTINRVLNGRWHRFSPESAAKILSSIPASWEITLEDLLGLS